MITVEEIQKNISEAIKYSGKTQTEIAKQLGLSQQIISSYVKQKKTPQIENLANLCLLLDLDANEILGLNKPQYTINQNNNNGIINNNF